MAVTLEEDMRGLLVAASVGPSGAAAPTQDWSIHISRMPDNPLRCLAVTRTGGQASNPAWALDYPSMQIMLRGKPGDYIATRNKAQDAKDALIGLPSQDIGSTRWVSVTMIGDINWLGYDERECPRLSLNFSLIIEPPPGANRDPL